MAHSIDQDDCPKCGRIFGLADESCQGCGFDPVDSPEDEIEYEKYLAKKKELRNANHQP